MSFVKSVTPMACTISASEAAPDTAARIFRQTGSFFTVRVAFSGAGGMRWYSGKGGSGSTAPPQARELVLIAVLVALNVARRAAFFMLPEFKPVVAMTILAGVAFGGETGFLVGAMTMLVSNMLFSQGPWTPWQMFAMGIIGWLAGVLYRKGVLRRGRLSLCIFGVIASTIIYGGIMNPASALMWSNTINWKIILGRFAARVLRCRSDGG